MKRFAGLLLAAVSLFAAVDYVAEGNRWWAHVTFLADDKLEGREVGKEGYRDPAWFHCRLVVDHNGRRLAKRHDALSLRSLRQRGLTPMNILSAELPEEA